MNKSIEIAFKLHARLPAFARKVRQATAVIKKMLARCRNPYIAFSTGKDSTVTADLVWRLAPDIPAVYFDADCAFPESTALLERYEQAGHPIIRWPTEPMLDTLERVGGPTAPGCEMETMRSTVYRPAEALVQEYHFDGLFLGLRAEESYARRKLAQVKGELFRRKSGLWECLPVAWWDFNDIWAYIFSYNIDYCAVYDRLARMGIPPSDSRLSYWAGETKHRQGRWVILRRGWPELFNKFAARFPEVARYT